MYNDITKEKDMFGFNKEKAKELEPSEVTADAANKINEEKAEKVVETPPLTWKEARALKRAHYAEKHSGYKKIFVLFNKNTGQIAEVRGVSSLHACNSIGWRARLVKIIEEKDVVNEEEKNHTSGSSEHSEHCDHEHCEHPEHSKP